LVKELKKQIFKKIIIKNLTLEREREGERGREREREGERGREREREGERGREVSTIKVDYCYHLRH
jgi:hypothetical protein